jgi:hypothetical protein
MAQFRAWFRKALVSFPVRAIRREWLGRQDPGLSLIHSQL